MHGLGGDITCAMYVNRKWSVDTYITEIKRTVREQRNKYVFGQKQDPIIVVTTNHMQKNANKALLTLGFQHSKWMKKNQHDDRMLRVWWLMPETEV
jgi:phage gp16-like protein